MIERLMYKIRNKILAAWSREILKRDYSLVPEEAQKHFYERGFKVGVATTTMLMRLELDEMDNLSNNIRHDV